MIEAPLRHLLFMLGLLFVILSSGSLQCALHCYESQIADDANTVLVTNCHPLALETEAIRSVADCCHPAHSSSQAKGDPQLLSLNTGHLLAWSGSRTYAPLLRRAEPVPHAQFFVASMPLPAHNVPSFLHLEQIRATVLLM